ncbi:Hemolymph lipopolysaccharide-binding protein [Eumeta japonica]|uniref:Hemolymph lipopolysaccharide-binding protein n=1 Tax=Eumeta variegata TaxID=151549 RepID=A0A4C1V993_EUMVA|nr:Hemolymph lipopolysaccharide-binding protein [Eumeta japonica]
MHGKPSEVNDTGRCIAMNLYGGLVDRSCETLRPFVCKKSIYHPTFNSVCNTPYSAYVPNENFTRCYKFLTNRITWTEGFEICNEESSYLFIPNDEEEINLITNGVENVKEEYGTVLIAVGLHNMFKDDMYLTIHGQKIEVVDNQWQDGEPNIRPNENCLFLSSRKLADYFCNNHDLLSYVVCERDIVDINIPVSESSDNPLPFRYFDPPDPLPLTILLLSKGLAIYW